jgi:murein DD-endopeptidase MepM/ murein hydrolase activator NlpD
VESGTGSGNLSPTAIPEQVKTAPDYDPDIIAAPYESFIVTQGPHGFDYGHMAVDISGGKGVTIRSPINGTVTNLYIDDWGNPSLVLENEHYIVELLHGKFTVQIGDRVELGQSIGRESNLGNIADVNGRPCQQFDCGYHTHINVYDKQLGTNVNPLDLFGN